jgi:hypothetical protein
VADFRSERMPSPEGEGRAKDSMEAAYDRYIAVNKSINKRIFGAFPEAREMLRGYAASRIVDLFGFWLLWRLMGGFDGMQKGLKISRSGMFRRISMFREVFGEHPDVYEFPGVTIDQEAFLRGMYERKQNSQS